MSTSRIFTTSTIARIFAVVLALQGTVSAQLLNGSFENWTDCTPDDWATPNACGIFTPVTKSSTSQSGSWAVRGEVVEFFGNRIQPFIQSGSDAEGVPVSARYTAVQGYYMFTPVGGDRFAVNVAFHRGENVIGHGASAITNAAPSYTQFNIPITYTSPDVPDKVIVQIQIVGPITGADFHTGSVMFVDNLSLSTGSPGTGTTNPPAITVGRDGAAVVVSWPADPAGYVLQSTPTLRPTQWANVPGLGTSRTYRFTPTSQSFFRLVKP